MMSTDSSNGSTNRPHCQFFVVKKKRFCRMTIKKGEQYCGEHIDSDELQVRIHIICILYIIKFLK
jgi:tRNA:m4X modification enzyme